MIWKKLFGDSTTVEAALEASGVSPDEITWAERNGMLGLLAIDRLLITDPPKYDLGEVADATGFELEQVRRFWRALGFADPRPGEKVFTDLDVGVLQTVEPFVQEGVLDPEMALNMTRVLGSSLARVASAQVSAILERGARSSEGGSEVDDLVTAKPFAERAGVLLEVIPRVMDYVWRRQLQIEARRRLMRSTRAGAAEDQLAVGFADLVGFTALSQQVPDDELAHLVDRFQGVAYDVVAECGGRVVKTIGDEVMFSVESPGSAAEIALRLAESFHHDQMLSDVRVGLAYGSVLEWEGDLFGPVVNLASRLVNIAYPGTVVVSSEMAEALGVDPGYYIKPIRAHTLKDIGKVEPFKLQRPEERRPSVLELARERREVGRQWIEEHFGNLLGSGDEPSG